MCFGGLVVLSCAATEYHGGMNCRVADGGNRMVDASVESEISERSQSRALVMFLGSFVVALMGWLSPSPARKNNAGNLVLEATTSADMAQRPSLQLRVDVCRASVEEWCLLPGIGRQLAERIVAHRVRTGPFANLDSLGDVRGLGPSKLAAIAPYLEWDSESAAEIQPKVTRSQVANRDPSETKSLDL